MRAVEGLPNCACRAHILFRKKKEFVFGSDWAASQGLGRVAPTRRRAARAQAVRRLLVSPPV